MKYISGRLISTKLERCSQKKNSMFIYQRKFWQSLATPSLNKFTVRFPDRRKPVNIPLQCARIGKNSATIFFVTNDTVKSIHLFRNFIFFSTI